MTSNCLHVWQLEVKARGYWFTSGGEKGSFGYYPHLKEILDNREYPVYPDTQVHGDLKMSAFWLSKLKPDEYSPDFVSLVFGDKNEDSKHVRRQSKVFVTDLTLSDKTNWQQSRFQIKPRIEIDDTKRTVKEHMLVSLEMAYLEGLTLTSTVYLCGEFKDEEFDKAKRLITETVGLLTGFGAFRSRGYGRGEIRLVETKIDLKSSINLKGSESVLLLKSLVNFRNRQIYPGTEQTLKTEPVITPDKVKAWIAQAYKTTYNRWLTDEEMSQVAISQLNPIMPDSQKLTYPSALSALKNEAEVIFDLTGIEPTSDTQENLFSTKTKALPKTCFITNETSPVLYEIPVYRRIRNSIDESFKTLKEGGLIVQEYIPAGQSFAGILKINASDAFAQEVLSLFISQLIIINGCLFKASLLELSSKSTLPHTHPLLVTEPITFDHKEGFINHLGCEFQKVGSRYTKPKANQIRLTTHRSYNTMLNRQRRPKIVIQTGSVINSISDEVTKKYESNLLSWQGFGKKINQFKQTTPSKHQAITTNTIPDSDIDSILKGLINEGMSRSQAGFLRGYLNKKQDKAFLLTLTKDRIEKYERKGLKGFKTLYEKLLEYIESGNFAFMRIFIERLLDRLYVKWWDKRIKEGKK